MNKFNIQPLKDRVLVKAHVAEEKSRGGIIIPNNAKEKSQKGTVLAIGKGKNDDPVTVKVGDTVLFEKDAGTEIIIDGINALMMKESNIFGVI